MKKFSTYLFIILLVLASCKSSSKLVEQGDYDKAIDRSIKKILKGKADADDILMLDRAYKLANTKNQERIKILKSEGKPENWERIYFQYLALNNRQEIVRKVLPVKAKGQTLNYAQIDYSSSIGEAKTKAAEFFYNNGARLMQIGEKYAYRDAYFNFNKAKKYRGSAYPEIDKLLIDSRYFGTSRVLVDATNGSRTRISPDFFDNLLSVNTNKLNSFWVEYHIGRSDRNIDYDYAITIIVMNILVSPEKYDQKEFLRQKKVPDGFTYALDAKGNVMKDTVGNDIKIPKYKELKCTVVERHQTKDVKIEAQLEYLELKPGRRVVKLVPVSASSFFEHVSGKAVGDLGALTLEDVKLIDRDSAPFPTDVDMIYDCTKPLQQSISEALHANKGLIK